MNSPNSPNTSNTSIDPSISNLLGKPGEGIHAARLFGFARNDTLLTIVGAGLISYFFSLPFLWTLLVIFLTGIILHRIFNVRTTLDRILFPNASI